MSDLMQMPTNKSKQFCGIVLGGWYDHWFGAICDHISLSLALSLSGIKVSDLSLISADYFPPNSLICFTLIHRTVNPICPLPLQRRRTRCQHTIPAELRGAPLLTPHQPSPLIQHCHVPRKQGTSPGPIENVSQLSPQHPRDVLGTSCKTS